MTGAAVIHFNVAAECDDVTCPWCSNVNAFDEALLGVLGSLTHYRCRYCGAGFSDEGDDALSREASHFAP